MYVSYAFGPNTLSCMVQPQYNGEPEKADLSRLVKFMSDDSIKNVAAMVFAN